MTRLQGIPVIAGEGRGVILCFEQAISFWGGIDPTTGQVADPRHPQHGASIAGRVLVLPGTIGSSSSSYIMLELLASGHAPAALIVAEPDAILSLGVLVAREMGYRGIPITQLSRDDQATLRTGATAQIQSDGGVVVTADTPG
ncbi:MAG: DUF126 domain-containing protein [Gemmatimonadaceae bacterium]